MGRPKNPNRKKKEKVSIIFDENKRREFLGGFHKRKLERQKKAKEELQTMLKEEKRRIKQENKDMYKKLVLSSKPIPELEKLLEDEYEDPEEEVKVKIVELSTDKLGQDKWLGSNKFKSDTAEPKLKTKPKKDDSNVLKGMELEEQSESEHSEQAEEDVKVQTKKDIKRLLKKKATKNVQKSKAFQMKNKIEKIKNKKKSIHLKSKKSKFKSGKHHK